MKSELHQNEKSEKHERVNRLQQSNDRERATTPKVNRLRSWTGPDSCSPPEGWEDSQGICTTPEGRPHLGRDERSHVDVLSDAPLLWRWQKHTGSSTGLRPKHNASNSTYRCFFECFVPVRNIPQCE